MVLPNEREWMCVGMMMRRPNYGLLPSMISMTKNLNTNPRGEECMKNLKRFNLAVAAFLIGSLVMINAANAKTMRDYMAFLKKGNELLETKDYRGAIEQYTKAIEEMPEFFEAYGQRGRAYFNLGNIKQSKEDLDKAVSLIYAASEMQSPVIQNWASETYRIRAILYFSKLQDYRTSIHDCDSSIEYNSTNERTFFLRGLIYEELGNDKNAIADYKVAARLGADEAKTRLQEKGISW
jgi:tetratricopeptide (TPR) repeat protein